MTILSKTRIHAKYIWLAFSIFSVTFGTSEQTEICTWGEKQAYFRSNSKPIYSGYVIGHEMSSTMSAHVSHIKLYHSIKLQKGEVSRQSEITVIQDNFIRCASVCFGVAVKGQYMEDLLESERNKDFTVWCREMPQLNATLKSTLDRVVEWLVLQSRFLFYTSPNQLHVQLE